jgi:hypothetical protein
VTIQIKNADTIKSDFINFLRSAVEENGGLSVTDYNIGSVLDVLVEAFADVLENYYFDLFQVTRDSLENIYNGFNFFKMPGKRALVALTIYIDAPPSDLNPTFFSIPRGTKVSTDDGSVTFEITDDYIQPTIVSSSGEFSGKTEYSVHAMCTETGTVGNVSTNSITKFSSTITNINNYAYWIRNSSASGGSDAESEDDMKIRFQKYLISLRRGTKESLEYALSTNAAFTGLMYSVSGYRPLNIIKQWSYSVGTDNYDQDLTLWNKFYPSYSLFTDNDAASSTTPFYLYVGTDDKFNNLIISTQTAPVEGDADSYSIIGVGKGNDLVPPVSGGIEYYDVITQNWEQAEVLNIDVTYDYAVGAEQYLAWQIDSTRWGKYQILDYNSYFIRINMRKSGTVPNFDVYKVMTYPFPGYVDIYCLKNYRDLATSDDKTLILESVDNYKAAGVITTVANATVVQLHPTIILHTSSLTSALIPSDIVDSIRADVVAFANTKNIGTDFLKSELYTYLYQRYNQYGNLYIYYRYDPSIYEDLTTGVFKEGFRDPSFDTSINEKVDLLLSDIYVVNNLNSLVNTLTGYKFTDVPASGLFNDYYRDLSGSNSDLYLAY